MKEEESRLNAEEEIETLKRELNEMKESVQEYAEDALSEGGRKFRGFKKELRGKTENLLDEITPIIEKYRDSGKEIVYKVEDKIIEKPVTSLLLAFVAGLAVGKLLDSGRRCCRHDGRQ